jgi:hypothetical protein
MMSKRFGWLIGAMLFLLAACGDEPPPSAGDPIESARRGLSALYSGDLNGVDTYFCDELVLDARRIANQAALANGRIDFGTAKFEIIARQSEQNWTLSMVGEYSIWSYDFENRKSATADNPVLIGMQVEDALWKICAFAEGGADN